MGIAILSQKITIWATVSIILPALVVSACGQTTPAGDASAGASVPSPALNKPVVVISSPQSGSSFALGQQVVLQLACADPENKGLSRVDISVDGQLIASQSIQPAVANYVASQVWQPDRAGNHVIEVRTYNLAGVASDPAQVIVNVIEPAVQSSSAPTPANETMPAEPSLIALVSVNVRAGPGMDYPTIGALFTGQTALITGIDPEGTWWQIVYPPNSSGRGWVTGGAQYTRAEINRVVPVVAGPPLSAFGPTPTACQMVIFDFLVQAPNAIWYNSGGKLLSFPGKLWSKDGFALYRENYKLEDGSTPFVVLKTNPPDHGSIGGDYTLGFAIEEHDVFRSTIGFLTDAGPGNARWVVSYRDPAGMNCPSCGAGVLAEINKVYNGTLIPFEVPLRSLAGRRVVLTLSVLSNGAWDYDWAIWLNPRIERPCR